MDGGVDGWMGGWMDGWMDGWMEAKAGLRIAYSNQKSVSHMHERVNCFVQKTLLEGRKDGWMGGWMDGSQSRVKDCLHQSKIKAPILEF